jgi:hypothetical protein
MTGADAARGATGTGTAPDPRAALRAFVRTHHPDVGGDPEAFRDGLAAHRAALTPGVTGLPALADDDPRLDAPVVAVRSGTIHRIGRLGRRLARRVDPRPGTPRVL